MTRYETQKKKSKVADVNSPITVITCEWIQ